MIFAIGLVLLVAPCRILAVSNSSITIGIIANGTDKIETNMYSRHSQTFEIVKHFINTVEVFNIFNSVRHLDADASVDVIILFDYDISILKFPQIWTTHKKKLIKMGARSRNHRSIDGSTTDSCKMNSDASCADIYCIQSINGTTVHSDEMLLRKPEIRAVSSIVKSLKWRYVIIFYENSTEDEITPLVDGLSLAGVMFALFNADHVEDLQSVLLDIYLAGIAENKEINIIVVCHFQCTRNILKMANEFDSINKNKTLMKKFSKWLIVLYGHSHGASQQLTNYANDLDNIVILAVPEPRGNGIGDIFEILEAALMDILKDQITIKSHTDFKKDFINTLQKNAQSRDPVSRCHAFHIDTLLFTKNGREFASVGYADVNGDVAINSDIFPNTKHGYNKRRFIISTLEYEPFIIKKKVNDSYIYEGFCMDLLHELANTLNFTYILTSPEDGNWGTIENEDPLTFNGLVGQLQREVYVNPYPAIKMSSAKYVVCFVFKSNLIFSKFGRDTSKRQTAWNNAELLGVWSGSKLFAKTIMIVLSREVDIVAAPISSQAERSPVMDFSYSYYYEYTSVLVRKPDVNTTKWRTLIDPLKWEVLVTIGLSLLTTTVLVFILEKYNPFYSTPKHTEERMVQGGLHELHSSFWYVFGALLCQGGVHLPQSTSGRTLVSFWWLTCIIIVGTYCGNLIAFLTVTKEKPPFNTLAEMLKLKDTYRWGTVGGTSWEMAFPSSSNPTFRAVGEAFMEFSKTDPSVLHQSPAFHINHVKEDDRYAWIGDKTSIEIAMAKECNLVSIKEEFMPMIYVFGFTNNSPHTVVFSEQMIKIHEGGLFQIWKRKWWPKSNFCTGKSVPEAKPISLMDVQSAFYVCIIGIFLGSLAFLTEMCWYKYSSYKQKRNNGTKSVMRNKAADNQTDGLKTVTSDKGYNQIRV